MNRIYEQGTRDDAMFFVAKEVEQTPAYGMLTLFVVGVQPFDKIDKLARNFGCKNIYFGTGTSFRPTTEAEWNEWDWMIEQTLNAGFWATLDFDFDLAEGVHQMDVATHNKFIPMISVKLAHAAKFNYNATLKIDDVDFDKTNPGVWCWHLNKLLDKDRFTDWTQYEGDKIVG